MTADRRDSKKVYDAQAEAFANKAPQLLTWEYIGKPAFERHLAEYFERGALTQVLDVGSASGRVGELLVKRGIPAENITGVEISPNEVVIARQRIPKATFEVGDIRDYRLPPGAYDAVTSNMVFEFLDKDGLDKAFKNISMSMKPGGKLVYITTHPDRFTGKYGVTKEGWFKSGGPWGGEFDNWFRSVDGFIQQTKRAGFSIDTYEEIDMPAEAMDAHPEFNSFGAPARLVVVTHKP